MKKNKLLAVLVLFLLFGQYTIANNWLTSLEDGKKLALANNKFVLVDFWASWCGPCKRMDSESWSEEDVKALMNYYVPVKIDIDLNRAIAKQYGVNSIPHIFIMDGNGKVIYSETSYKRKSEVISLLKEYALSSEFMAQDLVNYYKNQTMANSFRLGVKYQDFSLHLNKSLRSHFLRVSHEYFKEAEKNLKEEKDNIQDMFYQKIELYQINELLINGKADKALNQLGKMNDIQSNNDLLFNFLNYTAHSILADDMVYEWSEKVTEIDKKKTLLYIDKR